MELRSVGMALFEELLEGLIEIGVDRLEVMQTHDDMADLVRIILNPESTSDARKAALRALNGVPIRVRQRVLAVTPSLAHEAKQFVLQIIGVLESLLPFVKPGD